MRSHPSGAEAVGVLAPAVGVDHRGAADLDLAHLVPAGTTPGTGDERIVADDAQLEPHRQSHRAGAPRHRQWVRRDLAGGLGHAVGLDDREARRRLEAVGRGDRKRRRRRADETDAGRDRLAGPELGEARDDGGDRVDPRDPALAHELPEARAMETVVEHQAGAGEERGEQPHDLGVDVEERQRVEAAVALGQLVVLDHAARRVEELVLVQTDHLGRTRRARGGEDDAARRGAGCRPGHASTDATGLGASEASSTQGHGAPAGAARSDRTTSAPTLAASDPRPLGPVSGDAGSSGATHKPDAIAPTKAAAHCNGSGHRRGPTVVPGRSGDRAKAVRQCSRAPKVRTASLRASST